MSDSKIAALQEEIEQLKKNQESIVSQLNDYISINHARSKEVEGRVDKLFEQVSTLAELARDYIKLIFGESHE